MIDIKIIREFPEAVKINIENKNEKANIDAVLLLDDKRRQIIQDVESMKSKRNSVSKEIAELKKNKIDAEEKIADMKVVSDKIKDLDDELRDCEYQLNEELLKIPNLSHPSVPIGKSATENKIVKIFGTPTGQPFEMNHIEIAKKHGILDFERGAKVTGSGFAFYIGKGAKLERALINFMLDYHTEKHGYTETIPPFVVNRNSMRGTGQLPKMLDDMYHCQTDDLFLIPTAEVPLTNFHSGEMLKLEELTKKVCGYSPCFRREAGSHGKEVHGFLRVHQFNKVELVKFANPDNSDEELESLVVDVEDILQALGLHYRILLLCSGDTSFSSAKTYDLEVWSPAEKAWLEVSSCSNFLDFQARRAGIRFKRSAQSKPEFVHTLNGSGLATSRIMVALLECGLQSDGSVLIPKALVKYAGFEKI